MNVRRLPVILGFLLLPLVMILTAREIMDSDLFWHLATGRWIVENGAFPREDTFSFIYRGAPWVNLPWVFQLTAYLSYQMSQYAGVLAVCGLLYAVSVLVSWSTYQQVTLTEVTPLAEPVSKRNRKKAVKTQSESGPVGERLEVVAYLIFALAFLVLEKRWLPRPEVYTHVMLASYIAILVRVHRDEKAIRLVWILPILQVIWVNAHAMYILGPVLMCFALVSHLFRRGPAFKPMLMASGGVLLACLINPYGFQGATYAFYLKRVMEDPVYQTIIEGGPLFSSTTPVSLWLWTGAWALLLPLSIKPGLRAFGRGYLLLVAFSVYFSTTMVRNLAPSVLMTLPFIAAGVVNLVSRRAWSLKAPLQIGGAVAVALVLIAATVTGHVRGTGSQIRYGWGLARTHEPEGAARFLIQNQIDAKVFSDSDFSNLMLWMKPGFEPYIDSRYAEVVPKSHYIHQGRLLMNPDLIDKEASERGIQVVVFLHPLQINRPGAERFSRMPHWKLTYFDHLTSIFFRHDYRPDLALTEEKLEEITRSYVEKITPSKAGDSTDPRDLDSITQLLGGLVVMGRNTLALKVSEQVLVLDPNRLSLLEIACSSGFHALPQDQTSPDFLPAMTKAEKACRDALSRGGSLSATYSLGMILLNTGRAEESLSHLAQVQTKNPSDANAHFIYARALMMAGHTSSRFSTIERALLNAASLSQGSAQVWVELGQLHERSGSPQHAVGYFEKAMQIQPVPALQAHLAQLKDRIQKAQQEQEKRAGGTAAKR